MVPAPEDPRMRNALSGPSRLVPTALLAAAVLLSLAGCSRKGESSPEYAEASKLFSAALAEAGDDAFTDPRTLRALELARQVDPKSVDGDAAAFLVKRIKDGIAEAKEREEELAAARAPPAIDLGEDEDDSEEEDDGFVEDEGDGPAPKSTGLLVPGSPAKDFRDRYAGCYRAERSFVERGGNRQGTAYVLTDSDACRSKHPDLVGMLVFIADEKVFNIAPAATAQAVQVQLAPPDAEEQGGARPSPAPAGTPAPRDDDEGGLAFPGAPGFVEDAD